MDKEDFPTLDFNSCGRRPVFIIESKLLVKNGGPVVEKTPFKYIVMLCKYVLQYRGSNVCR